ncbi:ribonuclease H-like domain-containing protein [Tanacetum coccineum]
MTDYNLTQTLADTEPKLGPKRVLVSDLTLDRSLGGGLQYLTFTRPDLSYALYSSASTSLVAYCDVDCAGYPSTRRSTSGYYVFFGDNLLSWSSKHHHPLSRSSVKVEYWGVANVVIEAASVIDIHFVRGIVTTRHIRVLHVLHVPSRYKYAYISTKGLHSALFEEFRTILSVRRPSAQESRVRVTAPAYFGWCLNRPRELLEIFLMGWTMAGAKRHPGSGCSHRFTHFMN